MCGNGDGGEWCVLILRQCRGRGVICDGFTAGRGKCGGGGGGGGGGNGDDGEWCVLVLRQCRCGTRERWCWCW